MMEAHFPGCVGKPLKPLRWVVKLMLSGSQETVCVFKFDVRISNTQTGAVRPGKTYETYCALSMYL